MEIKDFNELNALYRLLNKVKFHDDLDFYEFREFAGSPIIAEIFRRVLEEYLFESIKRGYLQEGQKATFKFESRDGNVLKKRIDELSDKERATLVAQENLDDYLKTLITPLEASQEDFVLLKLYAENKIRSSST